MPCRLSRVAAGHYACSCGRYEARKAWAGVASVPWTVIVRAGFGKPARLALIVPTLADARQWVREHQNRDGASNARRFFDRDPK